MNKEDKDKKEYELGLLLKREEDLTAMLVLLGQHGAEISVEPRAKRLTLAYEIEGNTEAVFAFCSFKAHGEDAKNLEKDLTNSAAAIRFLISKAPLHPNRPSNPMESRENRGRSAGRPSSAPDARQSAPSRSASGPLSNEALEKKIEEILQ